MKKIPDNHVKLIGRVPVGPRGQVVIPSEARRQLDIDPGDHLIALMIPDSDAVAFVHESKLDELMQKASGQLAQSLRPKGAE